MDEPAGAFRPQPAPTLGSWLRARLDQGAGRVGMLGGVRTWPVLVAVGALVGIVGGLVALTALRPGGDAAAGLPQAVRVAVTTVPTTPAPALVHVTGAVARPGVYPLAPGDRVADVLDQAGGPRADADTARLNLAAPVGDGSRVYVPAVGEAAPPVVVGPDGGAGGGSSGAGTATAGPVDLNTATVDQLDELPGIGPATAAAIVAHRDEHGPFPSVEALEDVPGIGPAKVAALRDHARA